MNKRFLSNPRARLSRRVSFGLFMAGFLICQLTHGVEIDRRVYIPSSELGVLSRDGKPGILLSEEEYQRLLQEALPEKKKGPEIPFPARLESVQGTGTFERADSVADECLRIKAVYSVRVLSATWGEIPFAFRDIAPISAKMDGRWFITGDKAQVQTHLFLYGTGLHTIEVELLTSVKKEAGERRAVFSLPSAPTGKITLQLPPGNEVESSLPVRITRTENATHAELSVGGASNVSLTWSPSTEDEDERIAPIFAQSHLAYGVKNGLIRITGTILFSTLLGDIPEQVSFLVPQNAAIRRLEGQGFSTTAGPAPSPEAVSALRGWSVSERKVTIQRSPGEVDGLELDLEIEIPFKPAPGASLPVVEVPGILRHYGELALVGDPGLLIHVEATSRLEPIEVPVFFGEDVAGSGQHLSAYRFFSGPVSLSFNASLIEPEMEATVGSWVAIKRDSVYRQRYLEVLQRKGERRRITFALHPEEELVRVLDANNREIEVTENPREDEVAYTIELPAALSAGTGAAFTIDSRIDPTGYRDMNESGILLSLGPIRVDEADRMSGTIAVGADPLLRLTDLDRGDLEAAPRPAEHPDALQAFFFRDTYQLSIRVSPKPSQLDVIVLLDLLPRENFLTTHGEVRYLVEGAGRKEFSLAFPPGLGGTFFPEGDLIKERSLREEDDRDVWEFVTQEAVEGEFKVHFNGDVPLEQVTTVPEIWVPDARRERGFIVVEANTETEIEFETEGLSLLDILDVPQMETYQPKHRLIGAYQYVVHPYSLRLRITRHEAESVLRLTADRLNMISVVSPGGFARSRAVYQVRGIRTSFLNVRLPERSTLWSANVGGEPVKPMHGPEEALRIPVGNRLDRDRPLQVELIYESPIRQFSAAGNFQLLAPRLLEGVPVGQTEWRLYLPREYVYSGFDSDLRLVEAPVPQPLLFGGAEAVAEIVSFPFPGHFLARHDRALEFAEAPAEMDVAVTHETYYVDRGEEWGDAEGVASLNGISGRIPDEIKEEIITGTVSAEELKALGYLGAADGDKTELEGKRLEDRDAEDGYEEFRREAGILPFKIELAPRGVEYIFSGLRQGEKVSAGFRRADNWNAWNVFLVLAMGLIFAAFVREKGAVRGTLWAAFILTALPFVIGRNWTPFCNRLLVGILLGLVLVLVIRIRKRWIVRAAGMAATVITFAVLLPAAVHADTVYIPYNPQHPEAATAEKRIYVPYDRFEQLWRLAKARLTKATEEPAPIDYALEDAEYTLTLAEESIAVTARYRLYLPEEKWVSIPFPFSGAEISHTALDGEPARLEKSKQGYILHVREKGSHTLEFHLMARGETERIKGSFSMNIPPTFASQVQVVLPGTELTADVEPYYGGRIITVHEDRKEILAGLGKTNAIRVHWYPEETRDRPSVPISANVLAHHSVVGTIENWSAAVDLSFPGEKRSSFEFELDRTLTLTSIQIPNLKRWTLREQDDRRMLKVELSEEAKDSARIELRAERSVDSPDRAVPLITVPSARQTTTQVALHAAPWLIIQVDRGGFNRIARTVEEVPGLSTVGVFETHRVEQPLTYRLEERPQQIKWELHYLFQVESRKIEQIVIVNMDVKDRPLFGLALGIPEGYRCDRIEGAAVKDWWESPGARESEPTIDVKFSEGILGPSQMIVVLIRQFPDQPDLLSVRPISLIPPTGHVKSTVQGTVLIASHVSVQPRPVEENALQSTSLCEDQLAVGDCKVGGGFVVSLPLETKLAYWFEQPDFSASFTLERVEARESVVWTTLAEAHETWIAYSTYVHWQLRQGSRRAFEFEAPAGLGEILVTGNSVREVTWADQQDTRRYTVHLDSEVFKLETFTLSYESPIQQTARVPHLDFPNAERVSGYILTSNASPYELSATARASLKSAQKSDVPYLPKEMGVLGYYKVYGGEWDLELGLIRTVAAETLPAVIDWVELETQIRRDGTTLNVATIRMQNKTLQFLPVVLPEGSELLSLSIAGKASSANRTLRNNRETLLVPLIKTEPGDLSYEIEITYERRASAPPGRQQRLRFDDPEILDIPVAQTFWTFYLPEEYNLHYVRGNMEETTRTAREFAKLSAKEEERQRLKTIITGEYDLKKQARAVSNLKQLQKEIAAEQGGLSLDRIRREAAQNPRLKAKALQLEEESRRINAEISSNFAEDSTGAFQSQLGEITKQIEAQQRKSREAGRPVSAPEAAPETSWFYNDGFDFRVEGIEQPVPPEQVQVIDLDESGIYQYGANVFIQTGTDQEKGMKRGADIARDRQSISQYFNLSQSAEQQEVVEHRFSSSNLEIMEDFGLAQPKSGKGYSQRIGGRFQTVVQPGGALLTQTELEQKRLEKRLAEPLAPPPAETVPPVSERVAVEEGSYSIPIPLPRAGNSFTFKKLKSDAEVRFTAMDRQVPGKALRIGIIIVAALLLHGLLRWIGSLAVTQRWARRVEL